MKSYTDLGQSRKLSEILSPDSADMYFSRDETTYAKTLTEYDITHANVLYGSFNIQYFNICEWTPAWSLTALLNVLPGYTLQTNTDGTVFVVCDSEKPVVSGAYDNPVDACYDMIINLHKLSLL